MLDADTGIADRDAALPGLRLLLDDTALAAWLAPRPDAAARVAVDYVRYKPGTSCVIGCTLTTRSGACRLVVTTYSADAAPKLAKTVTRAREGEVVAVDPLTRTVATTPEADRDLPGVAALAGPDREGLLDRLLGAAGHGFPSTCTVLSHRPGRRWVALVHGADGTPRGVVRAYRPDDLRRAEQVHTALAGGRPRTARVLGVRARKGLLGLEWVDGATLDTTAGADLGAVGAELAHLHGRPADLPLFGWDDEARAVRASARQVEVLLPDLAEMVHAVAARVTGRLAAAPAEGVSLHGDFSADQVVAATGGGTVLLDLDRAARGPAALDLGSWVAAAILAGGPAMPADRSAGVPPEMAAGYASVRPLPDEDTLATSVAAQLLRRAPEPFRRQVPDWPQRTRALVVAAAALEPAVAA